MNSLPYRPNVCMIVINLRNEVFLGERAGNPGVWQFPQGGIEEAFSLEENALRELEEEIGAPRDKFQIIAKLKATHQYDFLAPPPYAVGRFRGQSQTFVLVRYLGSDEEIKLDTHIQEFSNWMWCPIGEVLKRAEPRRAPGYQAPIAEVEKLVTTL